MAKVEFDPGIESVRGILMGTDPFYIRRYPQRGGGVIHIVQARPDRSGHTPTAAERQARVTFAETYGYDFFLESMRWMPYILRVDFEGEKVVGNEMVARLAR